MISLLTRLLSKTKSESPHKLGEIKPRSSNSKKSSGRREPPIEIDWSQADYVPLPPSPPTWEVDGRDEHQREYNDPELRPIFHAGFKKQHTKVVKLGAGLSPKQRQGHVGEVIANAYTKLIIQRMKSEQLLAAANKCIEMFNMVPSLVQDVDYRRFNRIIAQMDKMEKKHDFSPIKVANPSSLPLFKVSNGSTWTLMGERKLHNNERPDPKFDILAIDSTGTWLINRSGSSANNPAVKSVLRRIDREGQLTAEKFLSHDVYRTGIGATSNKMAIMDSEGILHIYDAGLSLQIETSLRDDPRVREHFRTIETNYWGEFKSQVRAVDTAPEEDQ